MCHLPLFVYKRGVWVPAQLCPVLYTPWTIAHQAPLFVVLSRQEYWSGLPCPPPRHLPNPGVEPASPALTGGFFTTQLSGNICLDMH